jgi:flagellar biosynthesis GTPase FlhF
MSTDKGFFCMRRRVMSLEGPSRGLATRDARDGNSKRMSRGIVGKGIAGVVLALTLVGCSTATADAGNGDTLLEEAAVAETLPADLASYVGQSCEFDYQVMTQGTANNYCDADSTGALVWVDQDAHDRAEADLASAREAEAQKVAEAKKKADEAAAATAKAAADAKRKEAAATEKAAADAKKKAAAAKAEATAKAKAARKAADAQAAEVREQEAKSALAAEKAREKKESAKPKAPKVTANTYYKNCTAVRNAGADPIYKGDPGYSRKLDRDGDGVACE